MHVDERKPVDMPAVFIAIFPGMFPDDWRAYNERLALGFSRELQSCSRKDVIASDGGFLAAHARVKSRSACHQYIKPGASMEEPGSNITVLGVPAGA